MRPRDAGMRLPQTPPPRRRRALAARCPACAASAYTARIRRPRSSGDGCSGSSASGSRAAAAMYSPATRRQSAQPDRCSCRADCSSAHRGSRPRVRRRGHRPPGRLITPFPPQRRNSSTPRSLRSARRVRPLTVPRGTCMSVADLGLRVAAEVRQLDGLPLLDGELGQRCADLLALDLVGHPVPRVRHRRRLDRGVLEVDVLAGAAGPSAQAIESTVVDDRAHPGAQAAAVAAVRRRAPPDAEKRFLDDVLGGRGVVDDPQRQCVGQARVAVVEHLDALRFGAGEQVEHPVVGDVHAGARRRIAFSLAHAPVHTQAGRDRITSAGGRQ